jgi:hypothetical protein
MDELIQNVLIEYQNYNPVVGCMIEIMRGSGGNRYKIPHMNKESLEALGMLPEAISCDSQLVQRAFELLNN